MKWLNHVTIAAPANGTNSHTIDPSSGVVVAGESFTPTAGTLLIVLVSGSVTSSTPAGWTLAAQAVNNSGLYLWRRIAAGGDTFTTTHNGTNFPVAFDIYEFPEDTVFIGANAAGNISATSGDPGPTLTGLTADANMRMAVASQSWSSGPEPTFTWSGGTEAADTNADWTGAISGYGYSLAYIEDDTSGSFGLSATSTLTFVTVERIVLALNAPPIPTGPQWQKFNGTIWVNQNVTVI